MPKDPNQPVKIEAAFFDVDNTLIRGSSTFLFGKAAFQRGFFSRRDFWNFAWHQARFIARGETAKTLEEIKDRALGLIAGHRVEELADMTETGPIPYERMAADLGLTTVSYTIEAHQVSLEVEGDTPVETIETALNQLVYPLIQVSETT